MAIVAKITTCLWFNKEAEDAANFYISIFRNSGIDTVTRYGKDGFEQHRQPEGSVQTVTFRLDGHTFTALNGGARFTHSPAVSFVVHCESQDEVDYFWDRLGAGGDPPWQVCGWLRDKFGVSWQIVPQALFSMIAHKDASRSGRVMKALMQMKKLDLPVLQRAYEEG